MKLTDKQIKQIEELTDYKCKKNWNEDFKKQYTFIDPDIGCDYFWIIDGVIYTGSRSWGINIEWLRPLSDILRSKNEINK